MSVTHYTNRLDADTRVRVHIVAERGQVEAFVVKLEHAAGSLFDSRWTTVARYDHDPAGGGHDVLDEGLHLDVRRHDGTEVTYHYPDGYHVSADLAVVVQHCENVLATHRERLLALSRGDLDDEGFDTESLLDS